MLINDFGAGLIHIKAPQRKLCLLEIHAPKWKKPYQIEQVEKLFNKFWYNHKPSDLLPISKAWFKMTNKINSVHV